MSIRCGFFNSINHDRKYPASDMSEMFNGLFSDGIFYDAVIQDGYGVNDRFAVTVDSGFHLLVGTGKAWFNKTWILNDSITGVEIGEPHLILPRIDAVALQIDKSDNARNVKIVVIPGIPAANPLKPTMRIDTEAKFYQYALAYVTVHVNAAAIEQTDIENAVGSTETPYALYLGQATVGIKVTDSLEITEPGYLLDATRGKYFGDRLPFRLGIDADGEYGYYTLSNEFVRFKGDKHHELIFEGNDYDIANDAYSKGIAPQRVIDLTSYPNYRQFTDNNFEIRILDYGINLEINGNSSDIHTSINDFRSQYSYDGSNVRFAGEYSLSINPSVFYGWSYDPDTGKLTVEYTAWRNRVRDTAYIRFKNSLGRKTKDAATYNNDVYYTLSCNYQVYLVT